MKLRIQRCAPRPPILSQHPSAWSGGGPECGVALVITLIMLAVITTLAIAFLAITQRETGAVDVMSRTTDAELAADSALERAKAEILGPFTFRNSTNYSAKYGAINGSDILGPDFMVSVIGDTNRIPSHGAWRNPSPPVFVDTNRNRTTGPFEERHFLDLNRNRFFEDTGFVHDVEPGPFGTNEIHWRVGDPHWIGVLQDPRRWHTNDNRYIARYAFMVQPIGRSLDANWIHNDGVARVSGGSGFYREQGVGSWEINLAAFLADLNTNQWGNLAFGPYAYNSASDPAAIGGAGDAFIDARDFLNYRFGSRTQMDRAQFLFPGARFDDDQLDYFANGFSRNLNPDDNDDVSLPWPGATSRTNFLSPPDFITKITRANSFGTRLALASSTTNVSYDRYTFYRMLAQLGTDSAEEEDGKININYVNVRSWVPGSTFRYQPGELVSWTNATDQFVNDMGRSGPELFFLTVVTNLLVREPALAFMVTNQAVPDVVLSIPVFTNRSIYTTNAPIPGPLYAGRVHQILQLAANIYDATTGSKRGEGAPFYPSIFRPHFGFAANGDIYITNYTLMTQTAADFIVNPWRDLESGQTITGTNDLVYGVPLIVAARKGFPSFSEVGVTTVAEAWRKLTFSRTEAGKPIASTNQDFNLRVYHKVQLEARNPYTNVLGRTYDIVINHWSTTQATNSSTRYPFTGPPATNRFLRVTGWPQESLKSVSGGQPNHIVFPSMEHTIVNYRTNTPPDRGGATNHWYVSLTNRLLFYIVDRSPEAGPAGRIVDAVTLKIPTNHLDIATILHSDLSHLQKDGAAPSSSIRPIWSQDKDDAASSGGVSRGVATQIRVSRYASLVSENDWQSFAGTASKPDSATSFNKFIEDNSLVDDRDAPFTPHRVIAQTDYYQVNDPMVHYTLEDLRHDPAESFIGSYSKTNTAIGDLTAVNLGRRNINSVPWNKGDFGDNEVPAGEGPLDPTLRDPGLVSSDAWNFPTNLFPSVGWIGRVHRGTPWQTIYLKSRIPSGDWLAYAGPSRSAASSALMRPERDWELLDIFTAAPHPNATRGRLSINQTNQAAWSAVLAGAFASAPEPDPDNENFVRPVGRLMDPVSINDAILFITQSINTNRSRFNSNAFNLRGQYQHLGQILAAPELSDASPFLKSDLNLFDPYAPAGNARMFDEDYERIPQQILSLLKVGEPRFVVYAWGQSLKPARRDPDNNGPSILPADDAKFGPRGLCSNYQITGETATRAVIRVEFDRDASGQVRYDRPHAVVESFNILPVE